MKKYQINIYALLLCLFFAGCSKDIESYQNAPGVNFYEFASATSLEQVVTKSYSFAVRSAALQQDTVYIQCKIMGLPATTDRSFVVEAVAAGTTAMAGTDYKILNGTVKADQIIGSVGIVLYRTADLKSVTKKLNLKVGSGLDFSAGTVENSTFQLNWNDSLIKPDNWDTRPGLVTYFGVYSAVKYQFVITTLGRSSFPIQTSTYNPLLLTNSQMLDYKAQLKEALAAFNGSNTKPLTDEFGLIITFP